MMTLTVYLCIAIFASQVYVRAWRSVVGISLISENAAILVVVLSVAENLPDYACATIVLSRVLTLIAIGFSSMAGHEMERMT